MEFTVGVITRCAGTNHYQVPITIGAQIHTLETTVVELQAAAPTGFEEVRAAILARIRSALLEANAATFLQVQTALTGNTFEV